MDGISGQVWYEEAASATAAPASVCHFAMCLCQSHGLCVVSSAGPRMNVHVHVCM